MFYERFFQERFGPDGILEDCKVFCPDNFNFGYDVVDPMGALFPQKTFMLWRNDRGEKKTITYGELAHLSNRAFHVLQAEGLQKGDVLMVSLKTHYEYWYIAIAAHKLGLILSPVVHLLTSEDFAYRIQKSKAKAFICTREGETAQRVREAAAQCGLTKLFTVRGIEEGFEDFSAAVETASDTVPPRVETKKEEAILLYFTSGTTGYPKAVMHNHGCTLLHFMGARYMQNAGKETLHFATGDTGWEIVCGTKFYGHILCETTLFVYEYSRFHPAEALDQISKARVTSLMAQPTVYRQFTDVGMNRYDLSALQYCAVGGEKLTPDLAKLVLEQTGHTLVEGYAQSEASLITANSPIMGRKLGSVGRALPKYHVELLKSDGSFAAPDEVGEIVIVADHGEKPIGLLMGYYEDAEATARIWDGNLFHTGDLATRDADGFLFFIGRADGLIKTKGYRVSPFELEHVLSLHPAVHECLAVGIPDRDLGQKITMYVKPNVGYSPTDSLAGELIQFHNSRCAGYKKIRALYFVDEFQRNSNGKLVRTTV